MEQSQSERNISSTSLPIYGASTIRRHDSNTKLIEGLSKSQQAILNILQKQAGKNAHFKTGGVSSSSSGGGAGNTNESIDREKYHSPLF